MTASRAYAIDWQPWLERHALANRLFTAAEERVNGATFGCRMCGQCALPATGYAVR